MIVPSRLQALAELTINHRAQWMAGEPYTRERTALTYLCGALADVTITLRTLNGYEEFADSLDGLIEGIAEFMAERGAGENGEQDSGASNTGEGSGGFEPSNSEAPEPRD